MSKAYGTLFPWLNSFPPGQVPSLEKKSLLLAGLQREGQKLSEGFYRVTRGLIIQVPCVAYLLNLFCIYKKYIS